MHTYANMDPEAPCPTCKFPAWAHDPAQAVMRTRTIQTPDSLDAAAVLSDVRALAAEVGFGEPPRLVQVTGNWYRIDSLDAAWAEAEAALPEGWSFRLEHEAPEHFWAQASTNWRFDDPDETLPACEGPTPAAALRALAAKLRERAG